MSQESERKKTEPIPFEEIEAQLQSRRFRCKACSNVGAPAIDWPKPSTTKSIVKRSIRTAGWQGGILGSLFAAAINAAIPEKNEGKLCCAKCRSQDIEELPQKSDVGPG